MRMQGTTTPRSQTSQTGCEASFQPKNVFTAINHYFLTQTEQLDDGTSTVDISNFPRVKLPCVMGKNNTYSLLTFTDHKQVSSVLVQNMLEDIAHNICSIQYFGNTVSLNTILGFLRSFLLVSSCENHD